MPDLDAIVVGAGPNGLAAALTLAAAGLSVRVVEGADTIGGGCRTAELTETGVKHDVCSTVHALAAASPFFSWLGLQQRGVRLVHPDVAFAHPLPTAGAGAVHRSVDETAVGLGSDGRAWRRTFAPLAERADGIVPAVLAPLRGVPPHPVRAAHYAPVGLRSAKGLARRFTDDQARALVAGVCAHAMLPLGKLPTGPFGALLTMLAHAVGWPLVEGGSQVVVDVMASTLRDWGGEIVTGQWVQSLADATPNPSIYLCGSATPPGGGVHGMCGQYAARSAMRNVFGIKSLPVAPPSVAPGVDAVAVA